MQYLNKPVAAIGLAVASAFVQAQEATYDFNIPAQPAGQVLNALAKQTGLQPFFTDESVKGVQSPGVKGKHNAREALTKALAGTGLTYQFTAEKAVTINVLPSKTMAELPTVIVTSSETHVTNGDEIFDNKSGIPLEQVPQSIQVIGESEFIDRNVQSIADVLKAVPSATVGASRVSTYPAYSMRIRGYRADQIYNGFRQRYYSNIDPSATSNIEQVEILKGPYAVLYGDSLGAGLLSITTKQPQHEFSGSVSALVGSNDQKSSSFDLTGPLSKETGLYYRLTGEVERSGTFVDYTDLDRKNLALSLTWEASNAVTAHFVSMWQERDTKRGTGLPVVGTVVSNGVAQIPINRYLGDPNHNFKASGPLVQAWADFKLNDAWTLTPRFQYTGFTGLYNELLLRGVQADMVTVNRVGRYDEERHHYSTSQLDLKGEVDGLGVKHHLLFGVEYAQERVNYFEETITGVPSINALNPVYGPSLTGAYPVTSVQDRNIDSGALYAQDRIDLTDRWNIILAMRATKYKYHRETATDYTSPVTVFDNDFNFQDYQLGSTYKLGGGWSLYGSYATGYSMQTTAASRSFTGESFSPDQIAQVEAGLRYAQGGFSGSASLFQINESNALTSDPYHPGYSIQTGATRSRGLELEGSWQIARGLSVQGGYAYMRGEVTKSNSGNQGFALADTPKHQANLFARYDLPGLPIQLRIGANYVGNRPFSNTANITLAPGLLANSVTLPSYTTLDLGATYRIDHSTRLDLSITNVTGKTYFTRDFNDYSVIPGDPRQINLRLTKNF